MPYGKGALQRACMVQSSRQLLAVAPHLARCSDELADHLKLVHIIFTREDRLAPAARASNGHGMRSERTYGRSPMNKRGGHWKSPAQYFRLWDNKRPSSRHHAAKARRESHKSYGQAYSISARMQPAAQMSIDELYDLVKISSGARYQRVTTYSVIGFSSAPPSSVPANRASPKSHSFKSQSRWDRAGPKAARHKHGVLLSINVRCWTTSCSITEGPCTHVD